MTWKLIDVDNDKWKRFGKLCVNSDITIKKAMDQILDKVLKRGIL